MHRWGPRRRQAACPSLSHVWGSCPDADELIRHLEAKGGRNPGRRREPLWLWLPPHRPPRERRARGQRGPGLTQDAGRGVLKVQRPSFHQARSVLRPSATGASLCRGVRVTSAPLTQTGARAPTGAHTQARALPDACAQTPKAREGLQGAQGGGREWAGSQEEGRADRLSRAPRGPQGCPAAFRTPNGGSCGAHGSCTLTPSG